MVLIHKEYAWGKLTKFVTGLSASADGGYSKCWQSGTDNTNSSFGEDKQKQLSEKFAKDVPSRMEQNGVDSIESLAKTQSEAETLSNEMRKTERLDRTLDKGLVSIVQTKNEFIAFGAKSSKIHNR